MLQGHLRADGREGIRNVVVAGAKTILEETGEPIGVERLLAARAANPAPGDGL